MGATDGGAGATEGGGGAQAQGEPELEARVRRAVERALGCEAERIEAIPAGLSLRRFARVWLRRGPAETLMARVDAPEDPAGRPAGVAPEPPLEPLRALLERHGLPVPARLGADEAGDTATATNASTLAWSNPAIRQTRV